MATCLKSLPPIAHLKLNTNEFTMRHLLGLTLGIIGVLVNIDMTVAVDPVTLANVKDPGPNRKDEKVADFSLERAVHFLDSAALTWQKKRACFTCHTNYAYLYTRPLINADAPAHKEVRQFAEDLVTKRWPDKGPRWDAEVIATAAALAYNDSLTTKKLHPVTKTALDRMWTVQQKDGGWSWLKCDWPPMESDDHYGVTLAAIATGVAPENYAQTPLAKKGLAGIRRYLKNNPAPTTHHEAMVLWASTYVDGILSKKEKQQTIDKLMSLQRKDGGWNLASLGNWQRGDGKEQETTQSDGYGTGFVIYVLRKAGVSANNARLQQGIAWLKKNQRESGRWFTRSVHSDSRHFITHAGTAFAVMALAECNEVSKSQPTSTEPE